MFRQVALILLLIYIASAVPSPKHKSHGPKGKHDHGPKGKGGHDHHHHHDPKGKGGHDHHHHHHGHDHHHDKPDCSQKCAQDYSPVCGTDGKTHSNKCALEVTACETKNQALTVAYQGECAGPLPGPRCSGGSRKEMRHCCSKKSPCGLGQGDCDHDRDCSGDLVCGRNNCGPEFLWRTADCCMEKRDTCAAFSNYVKTCDDPKFARGGHCALLVKTSGGNCKTYCEGQGVKCIRAMDNTGNTCTRNVNGHHRQTQEEAGCLQKWNNQICVCGTPRKTGTGLKKKIVCERESMNIKCGPNESIRIKRVRYGRKSKTICPHKADYNLTCSSDRRAALRIARKACQNKQSCTLLAKNSVFGDPCKGTFKYMTVKYKCRPNRRNAY